MRVHHLIAGVMHPPIVPRIICHVLLVEHPEGLVLVDAGVGRADLVDPRRLGPSRHVLRPERDLSTTAVSAVEALGFSTHDVRHIVLTHLDIDHVGGAADFPGATLHTTADEWAAATIDTKLSGRQPAGHGPPPAGVRADHGRPAQPSACQPRGARRPRPGPGRPRRQRPRRAPVPHDVAAPVRIGP